MKVFGKLFHCILVTFFLLGCRTEKNKDKQIELVLAAFAISNLESACDPRFLAVNNQPEKLSNLIEGENFDCANVLNYKLDSRIFNPTLPTSINALPVETNNLVSFENKFFSVPLATLVFGTRDSILIDEIGYRQNPQIYDYKEYRATLMVSDGRHTKITATSEESITTALLIAIEKCKEEMKK